MFKKALLVLSSLSLAVTLILAASAQDTRKGLWTKVSDAELRSSGLTPSITPDRYSTFRLNGAAMRTLLRKAPEEFSPQAKMSNVVVALPLPDGKFGRFRIVHSPIVELGLLAKYPELGETYSGQGIDDRTATVRLDFLPSGFHAMIRSASGTVFVDPYAVGDTENYIVYFKNDLRKTSDFECEVGQKTVLESIFDPNILDRSELATEAPPAEVISGTQLRTYRLALASTNEYGTAVGGGTVAGTLAAEVLVMNRVNGVYERDLAIRMVVVANNDIITYATNGASGTNDICGAANNEPCTTANDPYTNNSGGTMLGQNTTTLTARIGTANYDIGHVFSTGGGGVATLNGPCGGNKARGVTGLGNPVGDPFAIDYVAHEMGHQWGANHTFNGAASNCSGGNRSSANSYEPGSGITIMAYAGICAAQDLARNSIDTFHVRSLEAIVAYSQTGNGNTCALTTASGNTPPTISVVGGPSFNIPKQTPFALTATASDVDGDSITYDWHEYDLGGPTGTTAVPNTDSDGTSRAIFRPYLPTESGTWYFPSLEYILNNANVPPATYDCGRATPCLTGELLPAITRTMNFQVIARDNRANAGGINTATAVVNVDGNSGPFVLTSPNGGGSVPNDVPVPVTWNVANTNTVPVNAANVRILLSTDGGQTFPIVLTESTPNDGTENLLFQAGNTATARVKIQGVGNIFFDVSDANFTIAAFQPNQAPLDFDDDGRTDVSVWRPSDGNWHLSRSTEGYASYAWGASGDRIVPADFDGDGRSDVSVFRNGTWFILNSNGGTYSTYGWGAPGDLPVVGDYDDDGEADVAVYRSPGQWFILKSSGGTQTNTWGVAGDVPVVGDFDGDGQSDIAVRRPSTGEWFINRSTAGYIAVTWGVSTDRAVHADYDGDQKDDVAVWRPSTGEWFILRSSDGGSTQSTWGATGDVPVPGDYDGDGKADIAIIRNGVWHISQSTDGYRTAAWGVGTDIAIPGRY